MSLLAWYLPCIGAGGGGRTGGTVQVGGPFAENDGLEKSSSDGLVKDMLIWQHRALILLSPSPGSPMSISTSNKGTHSRGTRADKERRGTKIQKEMIYSFLQQTQLASKAWNWSGWLWSHHHWPKKHQKQECQHKHDVVPNHSLCSKKDM